MDRLTVGLLALAFIGLAQTAKAGDTNGTSIRLNNGTTITLKDGTYDVVDINGRRQQYPPGTYRELLKKQTLGDQASQSDWSKASQFVLETSVPKPVGLTREAAQEQEQASAHSGVVIDMSPELYNSLKGKDGQLTLDASTVSHIVSAAKADGSKMYYSDGDRLHPLQPRAKSKSDPLKGVEMTLFLGAPVSGRKGAFAVTGGLRKGNWALEGSYQDEGKQPADQNGPILNINRIWNVDVVRYFPFTSYFEVFVGAGATAQVGHKGPWWTSFHNDKSLGAVTNGTPSFNVEAGFDLKTPIKRVYIHGECRSATYAQLDIPKPETISCKLLSYLGLEFRKQLGRSHKTETELPDYAEWAAKQPMPYNGASGVR